jgi:pyridoxal phosphate enzyme (YggS family)
MINMDNMENLSANDALAKRLADLQRMIVDRGSWIVDPGTSHAARKAAESGPEAASVAHPRLIGASKTQPVALLEAAISLGLSDFGENRVQEAEAKWPALKAAHPKVRLHLIGPLQSNKAENAVALFDVIHTIDREKIADALAAACKKLGKHPAMLIQVNTGEEPQKAGVAPRDVAALLTHCRALGLPVVGLMCVPPHNVNPAPHFALLATMARRFGLNELSMGMSSDVDVALRMGATMVRVGTALFGERS